MRTRSEISLNSIISIIIPILNNERTIGSCLKAILDQGYPRDNYEILIVDNGSTDESINIIKEYPVKLLFEKRAHNSYMARNLGIKHAAGDIIVFLDADCIPQENWMINLITPFMNSDVGVVAGEVFSAKPTNLIQGFYSYANFLQQENRVDDGIRALATANIALRKEIFAEIGLFDEAFRWGGDNDFGLRIQQETNCRIIFQKNASVEHCHRHSLKGLFKHAFTYGLGIARFRLKHTALPNFKQDTSLVINIVILIRFIVGIILIPLRSIRIWRTGRTLLEGIVYPILDKLFMLTEQTGIIYFLLKNR
jgi:glycosyltransferase involved in cell wall biosynthesis